MQYDLNDMMVFLAVVEASSFTLAADRLGIPRANVSRKLSRLEAQLGITLLERSTRSQHLTEAGKQYLIHCKRIQEEIDLANNSVVELLNNYKGQLKVGASVAMGQQVLRPVLGQFMHKYPEINVQLNLVNRRVDFIEEGFDVVIRIGQLDDSTLIAKKLGSISRKLFASPSYLAQYGTPTAVEQLAEHQVLIMNPANNDTRLHLSLSNGQSFTLLNKPRLLVDDFALLKQSMLDGLGIAVLPEYMCTKEIKTGTLAQILPEWGMPEVDVYALYPRNRAKLPKVSAFLTFITDVYQQVLNR
ncbi:LysR family transcriptional regulator [Pseudoalteromonas citrea]|uniref:LysR family transcriptional regulator n=1 Tax=Pseudoalteromonas citrea TaxID=43655 RepID=A0A5S3XEZ9_9GAMM|nr:LysR family transcriptional regulator [Pseudoalteromonas citrea]TMP40587.1 LysR family transcriptional regulator [Pseudoalteromonas citrea]TMP51539.1 LysR family transcriptional regulator [Pseudoalteromonas citrea]